MAEPRARRARRASRASPAEDGRGGALRPLGLIASLHLRGQAADDVRLDQSVRARHGSHGGGDGQRVLQVGGCGARRRPRGTLAAALSRPRHPGLGLVVHPDQLVALAEAHPHEEGCRRGEEEQREDRHAEPAAGKQRTFSNRSLICVGAVRKQNNKHLPKVPSLPDLLVLPVHKAAVEVAAVLLVGRTFGPRKGRKKLKRDFPPLGSSKTSC